MGAILAILSEAGDPELAERLQRMLARSPYRGEPEILVEGPLAIGIQSMGWDASLADDGNWLVAFHGYIGNWAELAAERGFRFPDGASNADRITASFEDLGDRLFAKLRGEWAVLIWDRREQALLAARDLIGCRPLFRQTFGGRAYFATEVRQVLAGSGAAPEIDLETFRRFLHIEPNRDRSSVRGVRQVPAGGLWDCDADRDAPRTEPFFRFGAEWPELGRVGLDEAAEVVRDRLETAVARASAARPMGVALSGGLDSSTVWGILSNLGTSETAETAGLDIAALSLRYPGRDYDEGDYMEAVFTDRPGAVIGIRMLPAMVRPGLEEAAVRADTPYLANIIAQLELARAAGADGRTIILTGHGADCAFQGDLRDLEHAVLRGREPAAAWWAVRLVVGQRMLGSAGRRLIRLLARRSPAALSPSEQDSGQPASGGLSTEALALWGGAGEALSEAGRQSMLEDHAIEQAGVCVTPWEQVSAAFGVEVRHPLLDLDLLEAAFSVSQKLHLARGFRKGLLRVAAAPYLPEKVRSRRGKMSLSDFVVEGLSAGVREQVGNGGASGETTEILGGLEEIATGFGEAWVFPLHLLIVDLLRRG